MKDEFVMVPRELLNRAVELPTKNSLDSISGQQDLRFSAQYKAALAVVANQVQRQCGEPVALPARKGAGLPGQPIPAAWGGWNACLDEIAKLGPLYTHADPGEIERIKAELVESGHAFVRMASEAEKLRAQLAERDALLRETYEDGFRDGDRCHERGDHFGEAMESGWRASDACKSLSASAEPGTGQIEESSDVKQLLIECWAASGHKGFIPRRLLIKDIELTHELLEEKCVENKILRKDADRYRWLMSGAVHSGQLVVADGWIDFDCKDEAQKAIDEEIAKCTNNTAAYEVVDKDRKDAERYRWLRDKANGSYGCMIGDETETADEKDASVDEGMSRDATSASAEPSADHSAEAGKMVEVDDPEGR